MVLFFDGYLNKIALRASEATGIVNSTAEATVGFGLALVKLEFDWFHFLGGLQFCRTGRRGWHGRR